MPADTPTAPAWPAALIEAMARAIYLDRYASQGALWDAVDPRHQRNVWGNDATAALTALCASRPDIAAILVGEAVAAPRKATFNMELAGEMAWNSAGGWDLGRSPPAETWTAMLDASPYLTKS